MLDTVNAAVITLSSVIPLELFAIVSSFLEEIIAPIPSPLIGTLLGSLALASGYDSFAFLVWLALLSSFGKTLACAVIYWAVSHAGTAAVERYGKYFGVRHTDLIAVSSYFAGTFRDYVILIALRAIPFIPSLPISLAAGLIKTPFRFYATATFIGSFIRSLIFISVGYVGLTAYFEAVKDIANIESIVLLGITTLTAGLLVGLYFSQTKQQKT